MKQVRCCTVRSCCGFQATALQTITLDSRAWAVRRFRLSSASTRTTETNSLSSVGQLTDLSRTGFLRRVFLCTKSRLQRKMLRQCREQRRMRRLFRLLKTSYLIIHHGNFMSKWIIMNRVWTKIQRFSRELILKRHVCFPCLLKAENSSHRSIFRRMKKLYLKTTAGLRSKCRMTFSAYQRAAGFFSLCLLLTDST